MKLRPDMFWSHKFSRGLVVLVPEADESTDMLPESVEIDFFRSRRKVSGSILNMAMIFNAERTARTRLQQDCASFMVACITGDPLHGMHRADGIGLSDFDITDPFPIGEYQDEMTTLAPCQALLIHRLDAQGDLESRSHHFMVRTSLDNTPDEPHIYASKMGPKDLVVLHHFAGMANYYNAAAVRVVTFNQISVVA